RALIITRQLRWWRRRAEIALSAFLRQAPARLVAITEVNAAVGGRDGYALQRVVGRVILMSRDYAIAVFGTGRQQSVENGTPSPVHGRTARRLAVAGVAATALRGHDVGNVAERVITLLNRKRRTRPRGVMLHVHT